ncbi:MAG: hypothetical protein N3C12_13020 [Candidatus Binatia bacterium]|nr:hypothetical protein [Candidatus Binatia bacterium]
MSSTEVAPLGSSSGHHAIAFVGIPTHVGVGVALAVAPDGVELGVGVAEGVWVTDLVGLGLGCGVGDALGIDVAEAVALAVALGDKVNVRDAVGVTVAVCVRVSVRVRVAVTLSGGVRVDDAVEVAEDVRVAVLVRVAVRVGIALWVGVADGQSASARALTKKPVTFDKLLTLNRNVFSPPTNGLNAGGLATRFKFCRAEKQLLVGGVHDPITVLFSKMLETMLSAAYCPTMRRAVY